MAKRNCRRTANEREVHDRAVKMKRMTDEQLEQVDYALSAKLPESAVGRAHHSAHVFAPQHFLQLCHSVVVFFSESVTKISNKTENSKHLA